MLLTLVRDPWVVENRLHCVPDFTCGEDRSRVHVRPRPRHLSCRTNAAIAIVRGGGRFHDMPEAHRQSAVRTRSARDAILLPPGGCTVAPDLAPAAGNAPPGGATGQLCSKSSEERGGGALMHRQRSRKPAHREPGCPKPARSLPPQHSRFDHETVLLAVGRRLLGHGLRRPGLTGRRGRARPAGNLRLGAGSGFRGWSFARSRAGSRDFKQGDRNLPSGSHAKRPLARDAISDSARFA